MRPGTNHIHNTQTFDVGLFHLRGMGLDRFDFFLDDLVDIDKDRRREILGVGPS
jgi:hypothetical protein